MEITTEQKEILLKFQEAIEPAKVFRKLFWKWYQEHGKVGFESAREQIKQLREFYRAVEKVGVDKMPYIMSMIYYGRSLKAGKTVLQKPNGDYYVYSVYEQLHAELTKYETVDDPYLAAFRDDPDQLVEYLKETSEIIEYACSMMSGTAE